MEDALKVLVIDDDLVDRMLVRRSLKNAGMKVAFTDAENCTEALQILANSSLFDCIFIDYQLTIADTGVGMSPEHQATIFQRYRKGSHKQSDSGLGLHLVNRIVTIHQGTIQVDSTVGQGTIFTIYLPQYKSLKFKVES